MKQLTNKQHLCYMLQNSHLIASLPYIDQQLDQQIPKSKISYLIKTQQELLQKNPQDYISNLPLPTLTYANTPEFQREVERVKAKLAQKQKEKTEGQNKKKELTFVQPPKKIISSQYQKIGKLVDNGLITYQNCITKNINLQLYKKYGPLVLKEIIEVLDREKANLAEQIEAERQVIQKLNQNRKYNQTEAFQRENDIGERIKIMLNKRRKMD